MFKKMLSLVFLSFSIPTFANGILCSKDARYSDGNYEEIKIFSTVEGYSVTRKTISSGFGGPVETKEVTLENFMTCHFDGFLVGCFKKASAFGESNSWVRAYKLETTILSSRTRKAEKLLPRLELQIKSGSGEYRKDSFLLTNCQSI